MLITVLAYVYHSKSLKCLKSHASVLFCTLYIKIVTRLTGLSEKQAKGKKITTTSVVVFQVEAYWRSPGVLAQLCSPHERVVLLFFRTSELYSSTDCEATNKIIVIYGTFYTIIFLASHWWKIDCRKFHLDTPWRFVLNSDTVAEILVVAMLGGGGGRGGVWKEVSVSQRIFTAPKHFILEVRKYFGTYRNVAPWN